ncbi:hypothetical protein BDR05DRAFT_963237, partial [Suillus weaverae]
MRSDLSGYPKSLFSAQIDSDKWAFRLKSWKSGTASLKPYSKTKRPATTTSM